ncbi:ABC transporter ATP-binding protein [Alkalicella caledoniensis]|uniref:ABC transporter ATP-binding protein n=1 Tax=Alkalicella caledoniensis TaxID=2731377 RepID=A0A7G9W7M8_ALKCA|nr:ABC transporter ATP-binding protein [Alkalicella caledoniensis]QNO14690.1 ABC transporter ATP-binding protein [Alkalicella caledoniensis]
MISLEGVRKVYNRETHISIRDFVFEDGTSYCILGPSGSGKSTLLNIIAGITKPTEGEVCVGENRVSSLLEKELDRFRFEYIGYIPQDLKLLDEFTVVDNLSMVELGGEITKKPEEALKWVGLGHKLRAKIKRLSGGEKQRVAIARVLLKSPKVMLCDEPTGSLNTAKGIEIMELLVKIHKEENNILIVVTHDDRMCKYFDKVIKFEDMLGGIRDA